MSDLEVRYRELFLKHRTGEDDLCWLKRMGTKPDVVIEQSIYLDVQEIVRRFNQRSR